MDDLLVLGSGVAGLSVAIRAAAVGLRVTILTKGELEHSTTRFAQGGIAAALTAADSPALHEADTLSAGAGLCDPEAVRILATEGPGRVRGLAALGAVFDRAGDGASASLSLAREGGHSVARIVHAGGAATGAEVERALVEAVRHTDCEVLERWFTSELLVEGGRCRGVVARTPAGGSRELRAHHVVVATGGAGQLFAVTTNPALATGDGIAMALRAGAAVADVEFVQFHPTALHHPAMPRPLLSEALRGDGAVLRDERGVAFMRDEHPLADLAPRDVVAAAIARRLRERDVANLWLDATAIEAFDRRFPTIDAACAAVGLDPSHDWLPVAPAAHYLCGGVATDLDGATTLPGLWAAGEAACSGVHGANRLASNSLLDGLVFGSRVADAVAAGKAGPDRSGVLRSVVDSGDALEPVEVLDPAGAPGAAAATGYRGHEVGRAELQAHLTAAAGVLRDAGGLASAGAFLAGAGSRDPEVDNLLSVARVMVAAALAREESRGVHRRTDHPATEPGFAGRFVSVAGGRPVLVPLGVDRPDDRRSPAPRTAEVVP